MWDPSDLSAKRISENLNTLCVLGLASQRSFLQKTNKGYLGIVESLLFMNNTKASITLLTRFITNMEVSTPNKCDKIITKFTCDTCCSYIWTIFEITLPGHWKFQNIYFKIHFTLVSSSKLHWRTYQHQGTGLDHYTQPHRNRGWDTTGQSDNTNYSSDTGY